MTLRIVAWADRDRFRWLTLAAIVLVVLSRAAIGLVARRWLDIQLPRTLRRTLLVLVLVAVAALTIRQQLHVELLTQGWPPPDRV